MARSDVIQVVTLSPAVDITYETTDVTLGQAHRVTRVNSHAGGKALNVARILHTLGVPVRLVLPLGGPRGDWVVSELEGLGIPNTVVPAPRETRTCMTVVDVASATATEFNEQPPELDEKSLQGIVHALQDADITIVSGSVHDSLVGLGWEHLLMSAKKCSSTLIVDTSGGALAAARLYADYLKPNARELASVTGLSDEVSAVRILAPATILVSKAEGGATLYGPESLTASAPHRGGNPTGAGDALVAGFAARLAQGHREALRFGVAVAAASVSSPVAGEVERGEIERMMNQIEMRDYDSRSDK